MAWSVEPASSAISPLRVGPTHEFGLALGDLGGQLGGLRRGLRTDPRRAWSISKAACANRQLVPSSPSILRISSTRRAGSSRSPAITARSNSPSRTPRFSGWRLGQLASVLPRQVRPAEPDRRPRRADRGTPADRRRGPARGPPPAWPPRPGRRRRPAGPSSPAGPGRSAGSGPRSFSAWSMIRSGLVGASPCRWVSRAIASRYPRLRGSFVQQSGQQRAGLLQTVLRGQDVEAEQDDRLGSLGIAFSASRAGARPPASLRRSRGWRTVFWSRSRTRSSRHSGLRTRDRQRREGRDRLVELAGLAPAPGPARSGRRPRPGRPRRPAAGPPAAARRSPAGHGTRPA